MRMREFIDIVEATWWPGAAKPAAPAPQSTPIVARVPANMTRPDRSKAPDQQYSEAIYDLMQATSAHERRQTDNYEQIMDLAGYLKQTAPQYGMDNFIPALNGILRDPDHAADTAYQLYTQFTAMMKQQNAAQYPQR